MGKQRRGRGKPGLWLFSLYLHLFAMLVNFIDILRFLRKKKATVLCSQGNLTPRLIFLSYPPIGKQDDIVIYLLHLICTSGWGGRTDKKQTKKTQFSLQLLILVPFSTNLQFHQILSTCSHHCASLRLGAQTFYFTDSRSCFSSIYNDSVAIFLLIKINKNSYFFYQHK